MSAAAEAVLREREGRHRVHHQRDDRGDDRDEDRVVDRRPDGPARPRRGASRSSRCRDGTGAPARADSTGTAMSPPRDCAGSTICASMPTRRTCASVTVRAVGRAHRVERQRPRVARTCDRLSIASGQSVGGNSIRLPSLLNDESTTQSTGASITTTPSTQVAVRHPVGPVGADAAAAPRHEGPRARQPSAPPRGSRIWSAVNTKSTAPSMSEAAAASP